MLLQLSKFFNTYSSSVMHAACFNVLLLYEYNCSLQWVQAIDKELWCCLSCSHHRHWTFSHHCSLCCQRICVELMNRHWSVMMLAKVKKLMKAEVLCLIWESTFSDNLMKRWCYHICVKIFIKLLWHH